MLHINSLQLDVHHDEIDLKKKTAKIIGCNINEIKNIERCQKKAENFLFVFYRCESCQ